MVSSSGKVMMQKELNHISKAVRETIERIPSSLEVEEEIDYDNKKIYMPPESPSKLVSEVTEERMKSNTSIKWDL
jgi:hypothetical protein